MVKYELGGISSLLKIATNRSSVSGARSEARVLYTLCWHKYFFPYFFSKLGTPDLKVTVPFLFNTIWHWNEEPSGTL